MDELTPMFTAWRTMRLGTREVVDALVAPAHRGPSSALLGALARFPGAWYWGDAARTHLVVVRPLPGGATPRWILHAVLFGLTIVCSLAAGAALAGVWYPFAPSGLGGAFRGAEAFVGGLVKGDWRFLVDGWSFAVPLLGILLVHELGHYAAARRYAIDSSPPFFLPVPPTLSPIGSLGAFIRLRGPILDRRQLLDVGAAGPLAGFLVALAVMVWGYAISARVPLAADGAPSYVTFAGHPILLGESLLTEAFRRWLVPGSGAVHLSLPAFAGWVGAFVTGLNLLPLSQLDGGHVLYGLLGRRQAAVAFVTVLGLLVLAQYSWNWYIWVAMTFLIGGGSWSHPSVVVPAWPVPTSRRWVGIACVAVFAATFVPRPFLP